jgi:hypothetical protein
MVSMARANAKSVAIRRSDGILIMVDALLSTA